MNHCEWYISILMILAIVFVCWIVHLMYKDDSNVLKEDLKVYDTKNEVDDLLFLMKKKIEYGEDKRKWDTFIARPTGYGQYTLFEINNKDPIITLQVNKENGLKHYRIYHNNRLLNTEAKERILGNPSLWGTHKNKTTKMKLYHGKERIYILIGKNDCIIKGIGGFQSQTGLPHPWYYGCPIVCMEGGRAMCMMDYYGDKRMVTETMEQMPVEIMIPDHQLSYLPLYLQMYAMIHEHLSQKKI